MYTEPTFFLPGIGKAGAVRLRREIAIGVSEGRADLDRIAGQQGDTLEASDVMSIGPEVCVDQWNAKYGKTAGVYWTALAWAIVALPLAAVILVPLAETADPDGSAFAQVVRFGGYAVVLWLTMGVLVNIAGAWSALYNGYSPSNDVPQAFRALGRRMYGAGVQAFYAVVEDDGKPDAVTVFYDAIGAVEEDRSRSSSPYHAVVVRGRDGRIIMRLPVAEKEVGAYAELIRSRASSWRARNR